MCIYIYMYIHIIYIYIYIYIYVYVYGLPEHCGKGTVRRGCYRRLSCSEHEPSQTLNKLQKPNKYVYIYIYIYIQIYIYIYIERERERYIHMYLNDQTTTKTCSGLGGSQGSSPSSGAARRAAPPDGAGLHDTWSLVHNLRGHSYESLPASSGKDCFQNSSITS